MLQVMLPRFADSYILTALRCLAGFVCGLLLCLSFTRINTAVNKRLETTRSFLSAVDRPAPRIANRNPHGRAMDLPLENVSLGSACCGSQAEPRSLAVPKKRLRLTLFAAMRLYPGRREVYLFINTFGLLIPDAQAVYKLSADGSGFLESNPTVLRKLDEEEGLPPLLSILAAHSPAKRGDLLDEWAEFLLENSNYRTISTFKETLRRRLLNLVERGYVAREGNTYTITDKGIAYSAPLGPEEIQRPHLAVLGAIKNYNDTQTKELRERLGKMNPYRFESLIKDLLEAMDYEDVVVTKQSGDKGVDVVASFQFGITQIKEVVQVKRHKGNITRPVLDQLRGALPYHGAIRGTIITTGGFAQGCKDAALFPGAAPITLIDGDKVIELLLKHGVGVKKKPQTLIEIDESYFASDDPETEITEEQ